MQKLCRKEIISDAILGRISCSYLPLCVCGYDGSLLVLFSRVLEKRSARRVLGELTPYFFIVLTSVSSSSNGAITNAYRSEKRISNVSFIIYITEILKCPKLNMCFLFKGKPFIIALSNEFMMCDRRSLLVRVKRDEIGQPVK